MLYALLTRSLLDVNVLHDRNPVAVRLSDGSIRNAYTVRLLNKRGFDRVIAIDVDGPVNATVHVVGVNSVTPDRPMIVIGRDQTTEFRVLVTAPADSNPEKSIPVKFHVTDIGLGEVASATDNFVARNSGAIAEELPYADIIRFAEAVDGAHGAGHAARVFRRRVRCQFHHDEARDLDTAAALRSTAPIPRASATRRRSPRRMTRRRENGRSRRISSVMADGGATCRSTRATTAGGR